MRLLTTWAGEGYWIHPALPVFETGVDVLGVPEKRRPFWVEVPRDEG